MPLTWRICCPTPLVKRSKLEARAHEIAPCVLQADGYYQAADTVGLAVHPLLQFYGAEALVKAAILANNDDSLWLSGISYHGLGTWPTPLHLQKYAQSAASWVLEQEFAVKRANGVLPELCRSVGDTIPADGEILNLKDLLRVLPDLRHLFPPPPRRAVQLPPYW